MNTNLPGTDDLFSHSLLLFSATKHHMRWEKNLNMLRCLCLHTKLKISPLKLDFHHLSNRLNPLRNSVKKSNNDEVLRKVYCENKLSYLCKWLFKSSTWLTPRVPKLSGRLEFIKVLLHTCFLSQHRRYKKDLGLGMMLNGGGRVAPSSK